MFAVLFSRLVFVGESPDTLSAYLGSIPALDGFIQEGEYDVFGMSTLLTVTMPAAAETIEAIKNAGLREKIKIMIGGAPVTAEFSEKIGADEYAKDAWEAITKAQKILDEM